MLWTHLAPVRADLPVGAEAELAGLCQHWLGEVGAALGVNHGGAIAKALPALKLPLLDTQAAGYTALRPRASLPAVTEETGST